MRWRMTGLKFTVNWMILTKMTQKNTDCNDMKNDRVHVLQRKDTSDANNNLGENYKNLLGWLTGCRQLNENDYLDMTRNCWVEWHEIRQDWELMETMTMWYQKFLIEQILAFANLRSDRFFIDSNEKLRSCTRITDSIRIRGGGSYAYMSGVRCLLPCFQLNWSHDTVVCSKKTLIQCAIM